VDDASDATADVFVVVWQRLADCPEGDEARLWIYGVARNIVSNRRRARERSTALLEAVRAVPPPAHSSPESLVVRRAEYWELDTALAKLPARYREALILAEWDGLDRETIARIEGVSRAAIDKRISRAYRKLALLMERGRPDGQTNPAFEVPSRIKEGS
jgi:RNA polymerase sigma-70 factor (ECF subfamily)